MKRCRLPDGLTGPQHYWAEMIALSGAGFTIGDIYGRTNGVTYDVVKKYVLFCAAGGAIMRLGSRDGVAGRSVAIYGVADLRAAAPIMRRKDFADDRGRRAQQLWTAMRGLRSFTCPELAVAASTDDLAISAGRARKYVKELARHGYVAEIGTRARIGQTAQWRLLPGRNTGPRAPAITARGELIDRNLPGPVNPNRMRRAA